jgi:hypothetical protein
LPQRGAVEHKARAIGLKTLMEQTQEILFLRSGDFVRDGKNRHSAHSDKH